MSRKPLPTSGNRRGNALIVIGIIAVFAVLATLLWARWNVVEDTPLAFDGDGPVQPSQLPPPSGTVQPASERTE